MELVKYEKARQALAEAKSVDEVKKIKDKAHAMQLYAKQANDKELENHAAEIKLRAYRRLGELTRELEKAKNQYASNTGVTSKRAALREVGINPMTAARAETIAKYPERQFEQYIAEKKDNGEAITAKEILRKAETDRRREKRIAEIAKHSAGPLPRRKYGVLYADPPWRYEYSSSDSREIENQYPTMSLMEICELPIDNVTTENALLFLWTTSPKLEEGLKVIRSWGFSYRTCAIWDKEIIGMGYYFRQQHELLLVGTKGEPVSPLPSNRRGSVFREKRKTHSQKPTLFYQIIERMYPELRKLELFARNDRDGWDSWGNQVDA